MLWNWLLCERIDHMYTHANSLDEWMKLTNVNERGVLGWTLFVSWDKVLSSNLTISQKHSKIGCRMDMWVEMWHPISYSLSFSNEYLVLRRGRCLEPRGYEGKVVILRELRCCIQCTSWDEDYSLVQNELHSSNLLIHKLCAPIV